MAKYFDTAHLRGDIFGGLTAGVVALPLALAFGAASGAGPIAGLWGAIIVGFFAALFGGTNTQVTGPTGPMVVVFAGVFASLSNDPALVFAAVILAGLLQIGMGVLRLGQYIKLVPYPVVSGFMSGIGVIIIALQMARLFGSKPDAPGTIAAIAAIPGAIANPVLPALIVGVLSLLIVFLWPPKFGKWLPGALAALIIGTITSVFLGQFMPGTPVLGDIPKGLPSFVVPNVSTEAFILILKAAVTLALLGAIDSLLTSLVADNMTRTKHEPNKELIGQGIGNSIAGFFGAIPGAGATMRTVVNIRAGGKTRISGMLHSVVLVIVALPAASLASQIPHAVLAGILVKVGYDIIDWAYLRRALQGPRWDLALMVIVLGLTVFVDLITAVGVGVALAALAYVKHIADIQLGKVESDDLLDATQEEKDLLSKTNGKAIMFDFGAPLSFGAATDLGDHVRKRTLNKIEAIILDFSKSPTMDLSAARAVETIACDAREAGKTVYITGLSDQVLKTLSGLQADHCIASGNRFTHRLDALKAAAAMIETGSPQATSIENDGTLSPAV